MNENRFVVVGRIESMTSRNMGLRLVIGGAGPVRGAACVDIRDAALLTLIRNPNTGFKVGDIVSVSGRLDYDATSGMLCAVAAPDGVSRIARAPGVPPAPSQQRPQQSATTPQQRTLAAPEPKGSMFGGTPPATGSTPDPIGGSTPPLPDGFPLFVGGVYDDDVPF